MSVARLTCSGTPQLDIVFAANHLILALDLALDPFDHVLFEGGLSDIPVGHLKSGASTQVDIAICFVAVGKFEIGAEVRTLGPDVRDGGDERVGVGTLRVTVEG